jgi:hypothetical protein
VGLDSWKDADTEFVVWVKNPVAVKTLEVRQVTNIDRDAAGIGPEELGLTLADGKTVLKRIQEHMVQMQVVAVSAAARVCRQWGWNRSIKDLRPRRLRTAFGAVDVSCHRYVGCICRGGRPWVEWPLR